MFIAFLALECINEMFIRMVVKVALYAYIPESPLILLGLL